MTKRKKSEGTEGEGGNRTIVVQAREVSPNVVTFNDGYWDQFIRRTPPDYEITGKYLFFSENRGALVKIALEELENGGFHRAKVNQEGGNVGPEYVLCLYYKDDSRKHELARKYRNAPGIKYRYWKSDVDTLAGNYSQEFLSKLTPEERERFTKPP